MTVPVLVAVAVCLSNQLAVGDCFFCCEFHTVNVCYLLLMIMVVGWCGVVLSGGRSWWWWWSKVGSLFKI